MRKEFGQLEGDMRLSDHLAFYGLCAGDIIVEAGGVLHLYGMCAGNVEVKPGGSATIHGMCTGDVVNSGGQLEIRGMVMGGVNRIAGTTTVLPSAKVNVVP